MELLNKLVEIIGFDIVFLGSITLVWSCVGKALWNATTEKRSLSKTLHEIFGRVSEFLTPPDNAGLASIRVALVVLLATVGGIVSNMIADEMLDSRRVVNCLRLNSGCSVSFEVDFKNEDTLKENALRSVADYDAANLAHSLRTDFTEGESKAIVQHAYAWLQQDTESRTTTLLQFENLVVKTLRVLWLVSISLALVTVVALAVRFGRYLVKSGWKSANRSSADCGVWSAFGALALALLSHLVLLGLWDEQSHRYYLKMLHAYVASMERADKSVVVQGTTVPSYENLEDLKPLAVATLENRNKEGEVKMYEFSAAADIGGKIIVADNETGNLNGESGEFALFEVKFDDKSAVALSRPWSNVFRSLSDKDYDDIEGLAVRDNKLYMIGSHSLNSARKLKKERQVIMRLAVARADEAVQPPMFYRNLLQVLIERHAELGLQLDYDQDKKEEVIKDLNIEGLVFLPGTKDLLLGLRAPLYKRHATVLRLDNADALFDTKDGKYKPKVTVFARLNFKGQGISALEYDTKNDFILVASSPSTEQSEETATSLWRWDFRNKGSQPAPIMRFENHKLEGVAVLKNGNWLLAFDEEESGKQYGRLALIAPP